MENWSRANMTQINRSPNIVGKTPFERGYNSVSLASYTLENCDVEPVKNQVFEPILVYQRKNIDLSTRPSTKASRGNSRSRSKGRTPIKKPKINEQSKYDSKFHQNCNTKAKGVVHDHSSESYKTQIHKNLSKAKMLDTLQYAHNTEPVVDMSKVKFITNLIKIKFIGNSKD